MGSSNLNKYWEMSTGGDTGSICMNSTGGAAVATGLQCGVIDVHTDTVFTTLTAWDNSLATSINFLVDNGLTGVTRKAGILWPGYNRYFTAISISTGQISYYLKRDN
jgi:hypothetical protein